MSFTPSLKLQNLNLWFLLLLMLVPFQADAQGQGFGEEPVSLSAYFKVKPGSQQGKLYIEATIEPGWHLYSTTQPAGGPLKSKMILPKGSDFKIIGKWEPDAEPHVVYSDIFQMDVESFEFGVTWSAPFEFAEGVDIESEEIEILFSGQTCKKSCIQLDETLVAGYDGEEEGEIVASEVSVEVEEEKKAVKVAETPEQLAELATLYDSESKIKYEKLDGSSGQGTFWGALIGAFLGGMLLNLMPCVFPVLGIKVMGFVEQAGSDPKKIKIHGLAFAGGLIFSMWVLAGIILALKYSFGKDVNWGEQMGNSYFVGAMVILLFVLGLNLAGVFEMGLFMTKAGANEKGKGYGGSFLSGIITTLVATPCSGPFLGAAMGYTLAQPPAVAMFLFTIFGLGIAMPYIVLSFFPALINMLPRPGAWMDTFKKLMAFTLFAAAAFFVQSFGTQTGAGGLSRFLMGLCIISLAAYFYGKWSPAYIKGSKRYVWGWLAPILIAGVGFWMYIDAAKMEGPPAIAEDGWELWVPGRVEQQLAAKKAVWVDYTADW